VSCTCMRACVRAACVHSRTPVIRFHDRRFEQFACAAAVSGTPINNGAPAPSALSILVGGTKVRGSWMLAMTGAES
jgi:hypothetical protein